MMSRLARAVSFLTLIGAGSVAAQTWDTSGNHLLNGTYYFRDATYQVNDAVGNLAYAAALYGTISFDGNGNYTMNSPFLVDSNGNDQAEPSVIGTYKISASGYGFLDNPFGDSIYGSVSNGVFVGSSTESGLNDLFIAVTTAPAASSSTLQGTYSMAYMNFGSTDGSPGANYDALGQFTADGRGNIGTVNFTGYFGASGTAAFNVSEPGVRYIFSNGAANLTFPTSGNPAVAGTQFLYISPDGNFVFGGSPNFWDFFVGVRKGTTASFGGTYYQAGLSEDASQLASSGFAIIGSYYGSLIATSSGAIIGHQRFEDVFGSAGVEDDTYSDAFPTTAAGQYTDGLTQYFFSQDGGVRIGFGNGPFLGIDASVRAPTFTGSGVFLDPTGVRNAASFAPFTAQLAPGELIVLFGSGLANNPVVQSTAPFPNTLGGVQVLITSNNVTVAAPLYYVTSSAIAAVVPYATSGIAQIQVVNNGNPSATVTAFVGSTAPGVLTQGSDGISDAIVQHLDFSLVTPANPAQPGETLLGYVTGLGAVSPTIADGAAGPSDTLSNATNAITAYIGGQTATVSFAGLAPTLSGLYAIVFTVPTGVASGNQTFTLGGPDAFSFESILPVGGSVSIASAPSVSRNGTSPAAIRSNRIRGGQRSESIRKKATFHSLFHSLL
jgi:uncharacterized protein (TIGR03437 family)